MMTQLLAVFIFSSTTSFIIYASKQILQLALPKQTSYSAPDQKVTADKFLKYFYCCFFSSDIKNGTLAGHNMIRQCLPLSFLTRSVITRISFLNNRSHFPELPGHRKAFYFN